MKAVRVLLTGKTIRLEESRHGGRVQVKCDPFIPEGATEVVGDIGGHYVVYGMCGCMWRLCDSLVALEAGWSVVEPQVHSPSAGSSLTRRQVMDEVRRALGLPV